MGKTSSNVEMRKKPKLPQCFDIWKKCLMCLIRCSILTKPNGQGPLCASARNPTRLSFFAANLRKPRMGETCLIGVSVSGEHCSTTWSHVVYAAEQTKILGAAWIYRANRMFKAWTSCSADAKIPGRTLGKYLHRQVWNIDLNTSTNH